MAAPDATASETRANEDASETAGRAAAGPASEATLRREVARGGGRLLGKAAGGSSGERYTQAH